MIRTVDGRFFCRPEYRKNLKLLHKLWWRRGESNPRPKAFSADLYMLISRFCITFRAPREKGASKAVPLSFAACPAEENRPLACLYDAPFRPTDKNEGSAGCQLSSQGIVVVVCNYIFSRLFNESAGTSACNQRINYLRRTRFAPCINMCKKFVLLFK